MPPKLTEEVRDILTSGKPAHLVTLNPDGSPQVSVVWIGLEGDEIVCAHIGEWRKVRNIRRDPRIALSIEADQPHLAGLDGYLAITGTARISQGGAPQLLRRLAPCISVPAPNSSFSPPRGPGRLLMPHSQWHRFYTSEVAAPPGLLFSLVSDMPNYDRWLPPSGQFARTTDVDPYPVQLGSRYHDGKPGQPGKDWWGTVTGFQRPGSIDFHHTIQVRQLRATVDVHIHYSFEQEQAGTVVSRWLILDFRMPIAFRLLRPVITAQFDKENLRTMASVKQYAEAHAGDGVASPPADQLPRTASSPP